MPKQKTSSKASARDSPLLKGRDRRTEKVGNMSDDAVYFWRPEEKDGYLGQWYHSEFTSTDENGDKTNYENTEQ